MVASLTWGITLNPAWGKSFRLRLMASHKPISIGSRDILGRAKLSPPECFHKLMLQRSEKTIPASILLAEDEPGILLTFKAVLEDAGYKVESAPTVSQARDSMRQKSFDAVILAYSVEQEGAGLELAREAKTLAAPPAIVVYSGHPTVNKLRAAMLSRIDYFAFQPIDLDEIKTALFRLISRRSDRVGLQAAN